MAVYMIYWQDGAGFYHLSVSVKYLGEPAPTGW